MKTNLTSHPAVGISHLGLSAIVAVLLAAAPCSLPAQIEIDVHPTTGPVSGAAEPDAVEAARSIVARPGATMASTEFGSTMAKAPEPPKIKEVDEETVRQAAKDGAELIRLLGLVPTNRAPEPQNEMDRELFEQEQRARELLGDNPTVVYRIKLGDETLPDPMIVPWIDAANRLRDRFESAVNLIAANKLSDARAELLAISTEYPDSEWGVQAAALLKKLENLREGQRPVMTSAVQAAPEITLDGPVKPTTILFDSSNPAQSRVMILGRSYRVGQSIRQHPDHVVKEIRPNEVDIEVSRNNASKVFTLPVRRSAGQ
jgi:hypothetical protein